MGGRATTNILLAIIAGVLLFGSAATVGVLQWLAITIACLVGVYLAAMLVGALVGGAMNAVREVVMTWHGDVSPYEKWSGAVGLFLLPVWAWAGLTMAWFWFDGVEHPAQAVSQTYAGWSALAVMGVFGAGVVVIILRNVGRWLWSHRAEMPDRTVAALRIWMIGIFAVFVLPVLEWRNRRAAGAGAIVLVAAPIWMTIMGIMVSMLTITVTLAVLVGILVGVGVLD